LTDPYGRFYLQVFRTTGTLKNKKKKDKRREEMVLILGLAKNDLVKMMES
jgi:hypothetical protein